jgi:Mrp family chromosome partitioning ATPase
MENPEMDVADVIYPVGIERLRIIPSGGRREIPAEYFTSLKMKRLLDSVKQRYQERFVIIDAPPMTESADTQILSELCDFVILVVPYGRVTDNEIDSSIKAVGDKKLLGVVFNDEPSLPDSRWLWMLANPFTAIRNIFSR